LDTIQKEKTMKHGARNELVGEVVEVKTSADGIMGQAKVKITGEFTLSSVMTGESIESLELKMGDEVKVVCKAVNVLLLKD